MGWVGKDTKEKKMEQPRSFADLQDAAAVLQVNSLERLDHTVTELPFGLFSEAETYGPTGLSAALKMMQQMAQAGR